MYFSIVLCTYNGAARLPATLQHLAALRLPAGGRVELLLVNNASTDSTAEVAGQCWKQYGSPYAMQLLHMPIPGKSYALSLGMHQAAGDLIIICDDDNWLEPDYLQVAERLFQENPTIGVAGGYSLATAEMDLPDWFAKAAQAYACGPQWPVNGITTGKKNLWGAGMVLRSAVAKQIFTREAGFLLTCRKGTELLSGGDDEICCRCWLLGYDTWYDGRLQLRHFMEKDRLQPAYLQRLKAGFKHQAQAIGSYRRLYQLLINRRSLNPIFTAKKWLAWQGYRMLGKQGQAAHAADYLYFLTRHPRWQTDTNKIVWDFYAMAGMPLGRL